MKYDVLLDSIRKKGVQIPGTLLAFDPGEVSGCCVFKDGKPVEFRQLPTVNKKTRDYEWSVIEEFIDEINPDTVIIENYRIYAHKLDQHSSSDVPTLQLIGAIKYMLYGMRSQLFWDGNKRTSMIVANKILIQNGKGILTILDKDLKQFSELLTEFYNTNDSKKIETFLYENCIFGIEK